MKRVIIGVAAIVGMVMGGFDALAQVPQIGPAAPGLVIVESPNSVAETETRLEAALDAAGLKVAARVDHAANAQSVGLKLAPTLLLIFGNPKAGTALMERNRTIAIDLPLKVLIWEADGRVRLAYNDPLYLARRHGTAESDPVLPQVAAVLQRLTAAAAAR